MSNLPTRASVVIIGGGVVGCSVAYHLTRLGWTDVVLLERKQLTSGTTWHAAGLIAQLRATANMTKLAKYSQELYGELEGETGVATGFKRVGSITVALTEERREELWRQAAMARAFGVEIEEITPDEVGARYSHLNLDGVLGGVYLPKDGQGDVEKRSPDGCTPARVLSDIAAECRRDLRTVEVVLDGIQISGRDFRVAANAAVGVDQCRACLSGVRNALSQRAPRARRSPARRSGPRKARRTSRSGA